MARYVLYALSVSSLIGDHYYFVSTFLNQYIEHMCSSL